MSVFVPDQPVTPRDIMAWAHLKSGNLHLGGVVCGLRRGKGGGSRRNGNRKRIMGPCVCERIVGAMERGPTLFGWFTGQSLKPLLEVTACIPAGLFCPLVSYACPSAAATLGHSGAIVTFGGGGELSPVSPATRAVKVALAAGVFVKLVATQGGFAALHIDGTVVAWGELLEEHRTPPGGFYGGIMPPDTAAAIIAGGGAVDLVASPFLAVRLAAFAVRCANGAAVAWGGSVSGEDRAAAISALPPV